MCQDEHFKRLVTLLCSNALRNLQLASQVLPVFLRTEKLQVCSILLSLLEDVKKRRKNTIKMKAFQVKVGESSSVCWSAVKWDQMSSN